MNELSELAELDDLGVLGELGDIVRGSLGELEMSVEVGKLGYLSE